MEKFNPVGWFEIYVTDMDRATAFYSAVLQRGDFLDLSNDQAGMMAFPWIEGAPNAAGALVKMEGRGPENNGNGTLIYFSCVDCR